MTTVVGLGALGSGGFAVVGAADGDNAGFSVSAAGDFNGDGWEDFIVGAPFNDAAGGSIGSAYLIYGGPGGLPDLDLAHITDADGFQILGASPWASTGIKVSGVGDLNGDGFDDIMVGAERLGSFGYGAVPKAYIIFGKAGSGTMDLSALTSPDGFTLSGSFAYGYGSFSTAGHGDVNGDGFDDLVLGDLGYGHAYVVFGKPNLGAVDLANLGSNGFRIDTAPTMHGSQIQVAIVGDVNGDGFDDLVVSGTRNSPYGYGTYSTSFVVFGKQSGFGTIDLGQLPASDGFAIISPYTSQTFGVTVSGAGDVNGDGFADIIISESYMSGGNAKSYVVFGHSGGFGQIDLAALAPGAGFVIQDANAGPQIYTVSSAGDVNGDGFDDLLVGVPFHDGVGTDSGATYVVFGHAGAFTTIDLANLDPSQGFVVEGAVTNDEAGFAVGFAGDVNGDGRDDILVGAVNAHIDGTAPGAAYVVYGAGGTVEHVRNDFNGDGISDILWRSDDGTLVDWLANTPANGGFTSNYWHSIRTMSADWSIAATGDFNGDGRSDILWRNDDGTIADWLGNRAGGFSRTAASTTATPTDWSIVGAGDFNGDGRTDILWRNGAGTITDWLGTASGDFTRNWANAAANVSLGLQVAGTGDFNGDGREDILWRSAAGVITDWLGQANGGFTNNSSVAASGVPASWTIVGTGDFNGDGRDDILWRNDAGTVTDWLGGASGAFTQNWANLAARVPLSWSVEAVGDYNGDGKDDILWRSDTGRTTDWLGTGTGAFTANWDNAHSGIATSWHVQPGDALI